MSRDEDFVPVDPIRNNLKLVGVPDVTGDSHLQALIRYGLIQADTQTSLNEPGRLNPDFAEIRSVHIAAAGQYYLDTLCRNFEYIRRVVTDIPIFSSIHAERIKSIYEPFKTKLFIVPVDRAIQGTEVLIEYLTGEEEKERASGTFDRSPILRAVSFMPSIGSQLRLELKAIQQSLERRARTG